MEATAAARARHRDRRVAGDADHALAAGARRADRSLPPGDAAAGAGGAARGSIWSARCRRARSSRCAAAAAHCCCAGRRLCARDCASGMVDAKACLRRIDVGGLADDALRACIAEQAQAAAARLAPASGVMVQAVWFDAGAACSRPAAADDPSSGGRRGVVAHPGAGPGGGVAGDCARCACRRCLRAGPRSGAGRTGLPAKRRMAGGLASFRSGAGC